MVSWLCMALVFATAPGWQATDAGMIGTSTGEHFVLQPLGTASGPFSLRYTVNVSEDGRWRSAGAYLDRQGADTFRYFHTSANDEAPRARLVGRWSGRENFMGERSRPGDYAPGRPVAVELLVRPPLINVRVDGKLWSAAYVSDRANDTEVGLFVFDGRAEFSNIAWEPLPATATLASDAPGWEDCRTPPALPWGAFIDRIAAFAASDMGIENARTDPATGRVPPYVYHAVVRTDGDFNYDGAYPAFHHSLFIRAFLAAWRYYGDDAWLARARQLADWNLAHSSLPDCLYPNLPYSTVSKGKMGGFMDAEGLQLDKVGWMGLAYLRLAHITGEAKYREGARAIAETLLSVQNEDGSWYYRVLLHDPKPQAAYTGNQVFNVQFLEAMAKQTGDARYARAAERAWRWLEENPLATGRWASFYEDIAADTGSIGNWDPIEAGLTLLGRGEVQRAAALADWVRICFGTSRNGRGIAIDEQTQYPVPMNCHTLHWCMLLAGLHQATGEEKYRTAAVSAMNVCSYNVLDAGCTPTDVFVRSTPGGKPDPDIWYSLNFSPLYYGIDLMAAFPELAPEGENHLLACGAELREIAYGEVAIRYQTAGASEDLFKLMERPVAVTQASGKPEWSWDAGRRLLTVKQNGGPVVIEMKRDAAVSPPPAP